MSITTTGQVACEYLTKYPNLPSKTLARIMVKEHPKLYRDVEHARKLVRNYRGQSGEAHRNCSIEGRRHYRKAGRTTDGCVPLPEPIRELTDWRVRAVQFKRALVMSDIHVPFHDSKALTAAMDHGKRLGVDCVILLGDVMDFHAVSFWEKDPRMRDLQAEVEAGRLFLEHLRDRFPRAGIIYKEGNHEERLWRHAIRQSPETYRLQDGDGRKLLGLDVVMDLAEYGVELIDNKQPILAGEHLYMLHGHEFRAPFVNPVNPARGLFLRTKCNAMCGDLHQTSAHTEAGIDRVMSCWSIGCLCDLRPKYCPLNKWNHGFATIELSGAAWSVNNHKVIGGVVV